MKAKEVAKFFRDYQSPWHLYRNTYIYTACGPSVGMEINGKWLYCDNLPKKWRGNITVISVSSIVEGVDGTTEVYEIYPDDSKELGKEYWWVVGRVNDEANAIWMQTHGCENCAKMNNAPYEPGYTTVDSDCPECEGFGEVI